MTDVHDLLLLLACPRHRDSGFGSLVAVGVLILIAAGPLLIGLVVNWWIDAPPKHTPHGHCTACDYDLAGLSEGCRCPECGHVGAPWAI